MTKSGDSSKTVREPSPRTVDYNLMSIQFVILQIIYATANHTVTLTNKHSTLKRSFMLVK